MAALKFDEEVRDFETFAYTVMRHQIIQDIRRKTHTSFGKKTKLQKHQPKDDFWELRADEKTSQSDNRLDAEIVRTRFDRLTKRERMILEAHCAGKHGRDISRNLGMSRGYAHMALKSIVRKLGFAREATPARRRFD
jgi:RNA polymerase sigma factor (sigma-70 family)